MIFFTKDLTKETVHQFNEFEQYYDRFDFTKFIHKDKHDVIEKIKQLDTNILPDVAASLIAQLAESKYINTNKVVQKGLYCCQDIMTSKGYELSYRNKIFSEALDDNKRYFALVAGCQSRRLQRSRVSAAIDLINNMKIDFTIVFSGRNPGTSTVRTSNEAVEMETIFCTALEKNKKRYKDLNIKKIILEEKSHNTITNIKEFVENQIDVETTGNVIYIISSTFHLIRLSDSIEFLLPQSKLRKKINKIVFIGSESPEKIPETAKIPQYMKWMFYEVFDYLLNKKI